MRALPPEQIRGILLLVVNGALVIPGIILFDQIIRFMYEQRNEVWEAEERPCGTFYSPPGARVWNTFARKYGTDWTFRTPGWMREEPYCRRKLRIMRLLGAIALVASLIIWFAPLD